MPELRTPLPCLDCTSPQADDVRLGVAQMMYERGANLSPLGTPMNCCRIRTMGANMPKAPAATSGGQFSFGRRSAGGWPFGNRPPPLRRSPP
jgi:hypothetical protein